MLGLICKDLRMFQLGDLPTERHFGNAGPLAGIHCRVRPDLPNHLPKVVFLMHFVALGFFSVKNLSLAEGPVFMGFPRVLAWLSD